MTPDEEFLTTTLSDVMRGLSELALLPLCERTRITQNMRALAGGDSVPEVISLAARVAADAVEKLGSLYEVQLEQ